MKHLLLFILLLAATGFAQWPPDPSANLQICGASLEQAVPRIAVRSDGGAYVAWYDTRNGNYDMYMQSLDVYGNPLWEADGKLISNHPQDTWVMDFSIIVDLYDNAIITFCDIRSSTAFNAVVYKLSTAGAFLWGNDGILIHNMPDGFQASPKAAVSSDGNVWVTFLNIGSDYAAEVHKFAPDGTRLFGAAGVSYSQAGYDYDWPQLTPSDNGTVLLTIQKEGSSGANMSIIMLKLSPAGSLLWSVDVTNAGYLPSYSMPYVVSDGQDGALVAYYDQSDPNLIVRSHVQHVDKDGIFAFPQNGSTVSTPDDRLAFSPAATWDPATGDVYAFWLDTDPNQNYFGIYAQKFSSTGDRQWTDGGKVLIPRTYQVNFGYFAAYWNDGASLFFQEFNTTDYIKALKIDANGDFLWAGDIVYVSDASSGKMHLDTGIDGYNNTKLVWGDDRNDNGDIYGQDVNMFGQLGSSLIPVELQSITASASEGFVLLSWSTATETNNSRFEIERSIAADASNTAWEMIGSVEGHGTTTSPNYYTYSDNTAGISAATITYRLKQIDYDGTVAYSPEVSVSLAAPTAYQLDQNFPNPFNPATTIQYTIPEDGFVSLKIYDALGGMIETIVSEQQSAGSYSVSFDARNYPSGTYFYSLESNNFRETKKMILMK